MYPFFEANRSGDQNYFRSNIIHDFSFPPHLHPYVEIVYVIEGRIKVTINDKTCELSEKEAAVCFPNDIHAYNSMDSSKILLIIFSPDITSSYFGVNLDKTLENPFLPKDTKKNGISDFFFILHEEFQSNNDKYVIKGLLYTILGKLKDYSSLKNSSSSYNTTIQKLLRYIEVHYQEKISLDLIANDLGFSKFYLSRIFSNKIGYPFNDYVNRLRVNKAQKLLSETDLSVTNIGLDCGFESQRNFNRIFKEYTTLTPTEFRAGGIKKGAI